MSNKFRENLRNELNYQGITVKELSLSPSRDAQEIIRWVGNLNQEECKAVLKLIQSFKNNKEEPIYFQTIFIFLECIAQSDKYRFIKF